MLYRQLLQAELAQNDISLRALARKIEIHPSHLHRFLQTDAKPQGKTLAKLAHYFGRSESELLEGLAVTEELIAIIRAMTMDEQRDLLTMLKSAHFFHERHAS